jgi:hypothetical protein
MKFRRLSSRLLLITVRLAVAILSIRTNHGDIAFLKMTATNNGEKDLCPHAVTSLSIDDNHDRRTVPTTRCYADHHRQLHFTDDLEKLPKLVDGQTGLSDDRTQCPLCNFRMVRNGQSSVRCDLLPEDQMAASLPIQYILNLP